VGTGVAVGAPEHRVTLSRVVHSGPYGVTSITYVAECGCGWRRERADYDGRDIAVTRHLDYVRRLRQMAEVSSGR